MVLAVGLEPVNDLAEALKKTRYRKSILSATVREILEDGALVDEGGKREALSDYENVIIAMGTKSKNELHS